MRGFVFKYTRKYKKGLHAELEEVHIPCIADDYANNWLDIIDMVTEYIKKYKSEDTIYYFCTPMQQRHNFRIVAHNIQEDFDCLAEPLLINRHGVNVDQTLQTASSGYEDWLTKDGYLSFVWVRIGFGTRNSSKHGEENRKVDCYKYNVYVVKDNVPDLCIVNGTRTIYIPKNNAISQLLSAHVVRYIKQEFGDFVPYKLTGFEERRNCPPAIVDTERKYKRKK